MELAKANALKAINLDAGLPEAHVVLGQVAFQLDWNWSLAEERAYQRSIAFGPSYDVPGSAIRTFWRRGAGSIRRSTSWKRPRRVNPLSETNDLELRAAASVRPAVSRSGDADPGGSGRDPNVYQDLHAVRPDLCRHRPL